MGTKVNLSLMQKYMYNPDKYDICYCVIAMVQIDIV